MNKKNMLKAIIFLSFLGILVSIYLLNLHYSESDQPCDISETVSCSIVKESNYSELWGIPMALIGIVGYLFLTLVSFLIYNQKHALRKIKNHYFIRIIGSPQTLVIISALALLFSLRLTYAEFFVIKAICIFCIISQLIIILITILSYYVYKKKIKKIIFF